MTEIKKTLAILKARRSEVTLLVGLNVLFILSNKLMFTTETKPAPLQHLISYIFVLLMGIILTILTIGFQRTVYLEGDRQQSPMVLLKTGKRFFWRMFGLGLVWLPVYFILAWLTFSVIKGSGADFIQSAQSFPLLYQFCFTVPTLILLKPLLLLPVIIIVWDCKVIESFKHLKNYRIFDAKELLLLFLILTICNFAWTLLPNPDEVKTILPFLLIMVTYLLIYFISLMVVVTAVRFAASVDLASDEGLASSDSENLHENPEKDLKE